MKHHRKISVALAAAIGLVMFGAAAMAQTKPVEPLLQVPIPEVSFTKMVMKDGAITTPFIGQYISGVYNFLISIVGVVAAVVMMVGGFQYLTAGGDKSKVDAGKERIRNALMGMVLALGSYAILYIINPDLVAFKSLVFDEVAREELTLEPKVDSEAEEAPAPGPASNCSTTGFTLNDISKVDTVANASVMASLKKSLTAERVTAYRTAASKAGIPWEVLAATHYMEGNMGQRKSIMNGGPLCNTRDNSNLLKICPVCATATEENDLYCGAILLARSSPKPSANDIQSIKLAFCRHNGCKKSWQACPELSPYVGSKFDAAHSQYVKSGIDCVMPGCKAGCTNDVTQKSGGKSPGAGCCEIKVYKRNKFPSDYNPGGSACVQNQDSKCRTNSDDKTETYTYVPGTKSPTNKCGISSIQQRPGALTVYALIKHLQTSGQISR
jgi:hypothetical protein